MGPMDPWCWGPRRILQCWKLNTPEHSTCDWQDRVPRRPHHDPRRLLDHRPLHKTYRQAPVFTQRLFTSGPATTSTDTSSSLSLRNVATSRILWRGDWRRSTTSAALIYYNTGLMSSRLRGYRSFSHFLKHFQTLAVFSENISLHFTDQTGCDRCFRKFPSSHLGMSVAFKTY